MSSETRRDKECLLNVQLNGRADLISTRTSANYLQESSVNIDTPDTSSHTQREAK
jgi:hypothetical protein